MVSSYSKLIYVCICDDCGQARTIEKDRSIGIYNRASAVRRLRWAFSKDGKTVRCDLCRFDNHRKKKIEWLSV